MFPLPYALFLGNIGNLFVSHLNAVEWVFVCVCVTENSSSIYTPGLNTEAKKGKKQTKEKSVKSASAIALCFQPHKFAHFIILPKQCFCIEQYKEEYMFTNLIVHYTMENNAPTPNAYCRFRWRIDGSTMITERSISHKTEGVFTLVVRFPWFVWSELAFRLAFWHRT